MMNTARRSIKDLSENKRIWREKFKKECRDRAKSARQDKTSKLKGQWEQIALAEECGRFKRENEEAMRAEGVYDIDDLIVESFQEYENEHEYYLRQEQEEIELALASYEESFNIIGCISCQKAALQPTDLNGISVLHCSNCKFYTTEKCLNEIASVVKEHDSSCNGTIGYALDSEMDNTIMVICNTCPQWNTFVM